MTCRTSIDLRLERVDSKGLVVELFRPDPVYEFTIEDLIPISCFTPSYLVDNSRLIKENIL